MRIPLILCILFSLSNSLNAMEKKPYHHIYKDGKLYAFRNLEGGPKRDPNFKKEVQKEILILNGIGKFLGRKKRNLR